MNAPPSDRRAVLLGLGAVALWSTVATAFELALGYLTPLELIWIASLVSWGLFTLLVLPGRADALHHGWGTAAWAGLLNPVAYYLLLFAAYDRLPGQEAMALNYTWALTMALLAAPILGQRLSARELGPGLVAYAGVWVIATRGAVLDVDFADPVGVGAALASTLVWAVYWLLNARDHRPPLVAQWQNFTVAVPVLTLLVLQTSGPRALSPAGALAAVYVGLFELGVAFVLWQAAMRTVSRTAKISNLIFLSPPVSLVLLALVVGEPILPSTLVGLALILGGLGLQARIGGPERNDFSDASSSGP